MKRGNESRPRGGGDPQLAQRRVARRDRRGFSRDVNDVRRRRRAILRDARHEHGRRPQSALLAVAVPLGNLDIPGRAPRRLSDAVHDDPVVHRIARDRGHRYRVHGVPERERVRRDRRRKPRGQRARGYV
eukprot:30957-Pelagococcus_subviridis.AAC.68